MFCSWAVRVVLLPSSRSHLLKIVPPTPLANGITTTSLGLVSLNGWPKEAEPNPRGHPTWSRCVDVGGHEVVLRVGGLRTRKIKAGDSDDEPECRLLSIQEERCVTPSRRGVRRHLLATVEPRHEHVPVS